MQTLKETNNVIKTKRYTFLFVSDTDIEKSCFLSGVKTLMNNVYLFSVS